MRKGEKNRGLANLGGGFRTREGGEGGGSGGSHEENARRIGVRDGRRRARGFGRTRVKGAPEVESKRGALAAHWIDVVPRFRW